jgi:hypothetical protein
MENTGIKTDVNIIMGFDYYEHKLIFQYTSHLWGINMLLGECRFKFQSNIAIFIILQFAIV